MVPGFQSLNDPKVIELCRRTGEGALDLTLGFRLRVFRLSAWPEPSAPCSDLLADVFPSYGSISNGVRRARLRLAMTPTRLAEFSGVDVGMV
jgi:hypothetical protein